MDRNKYEKVSKPAEPLEIRNPYGKKKRVKEEDSLPPEVVGKYVAGLLDFVWYDAENCEAVRNFMVIQNSTHCTFSKGAKLWGARDYDPTLTIGKRFRFCVQKYSLVLWCWVHK